MKTVFWFLFCLGAVYVLMSWDAMDLRTLVHAHPIESAIILVVGMYAALSGSLRGA